MHWLSLARKMAAVRQVSNFPKLSFVFNGKGIIPYALFGRQKSLSEESHDEPERQAQMTAGKRIKILSTWKVSIYQCVLERKDILVKAKVKLIN